MTEGFWESAARGLFIAEYPLVERGADRAPRYVDGLILPDEPQASVRSILLCHEADGALLPLLKPFPEVEVWLSDPKNARQCKRIN